MPESLLAPVLVDTLLQPAGQWVRVDVVEALDSTNAHSLAEPTPWRLVVAEQQNAGRGRHARVWVSPPGASVSMTMTVPLPPHPEEWGWIPLVTGLAVRDALAATGAVDVALKWPNDVLVRAADRPDRELRKVCGILCESTGEVVAVGIGVNTSVPEADLPVPTATSLHLEGFVAPDAREQVIIRIAQAFVTRFAALAAGGDHVEQVRSAYRQACSTIGLDVRIHAPGDVIVAGRAVDVDSEGRLVIDSDGCRQAYAAGDVVHVRPDEAAS